MGRKVWIAVLVLVLLVVGGLVWAGFDDDPPRAESGETFLVPESGLEDPSFAGDEVEINLPWTTATLVIGESQAALPVDDHGEDPEAPEGGSFRPVRLETRTFDVERLTASVEGIEHPEVTLTIGAIEVELPRLAEVLSYAHTDASMFWYVAVTEDSDDAAVSVSIADRSAEAPLGDGDQAIWAEDGKTETWADAKPQPCERDSWTSGYRARYDDGLKGCRARVIARSPYVDGLGWAGPGHEFIVVEATANGESTVETTSGSYRLGEAQLTFRLDGQESVAPDGPTAASGSMFQDRVHFRVPRKAGPRTFEIVSTHLGHPEDPGMPAAPEIVRTITTTLEVAS